MQNGHGFLILTGLQAQAQGQLGLKQPNPLCSQPFCEIPGRGWNLRVKALVLPVLTVPKPLVTWYCQMALLSEPVVSTSALNITTLIPFPRWWQRDNVLGTLGSLERNVLVPFREDSGIETVPQLPHSVHPVPCCRQGNSGESVPGPAVDADEAPVCCMGCFPRLWRNPC